MLYVIRIAMSLNRDGAKMLGECANTKQKKETATWRVVYKYKQTQQHSVCYMITKVHNSCAYRKRTTG